MERDILPGRMQEFIDHFDPSREVGSLATATPTKVVEVEASNQVFLEDYAAPGRVGLVGGSSLIDSLIQIATRKLMPGKARGRWSHAWIFQGRRRDGHNWIIESDLETGIKHNRMGVQENRIAKFFDPEACPALAVLDFGLSESEVDRVIAHALDLVACQATYSLLEVLGTALALQAGTTRQKRNLLGKRRSMYCSAMVQYVFYKAEIDLVPGVHPSHSTPEDLARSPRIQTLYLLKQPQAE